MDIDDLEISKYRSNLQVCEIQFDYMNSWASNQFAIWMSSSESDGFFWKADGEQISNLHCVNQIMQNRRGYDIVIFCVAIFTVSIKICKTDAIYGRVEL